MRITKSKLAQIIKEELNEFNYSAAAGKDLRAAQLAMDGPPEPGPDLPELTLVNLLAELQALLGEWQKKDYPSDEARYEGYYADIAEVVDRYDPCSHPGESCEDAHPDQSHEECMGNQEENDEKIKA
jgi:hypothetical protein